MYSFGELACLFLMQFVASRRRRHPAVYFYTIKQSEDESQKVCFSRLNKEYMTTNDQDEKITLVALLGKVWPQSQFMVELAKRTPATLWEFMDQADNFINVEDILRALTKPRRKEPKHADKKGKARAKGKVHEKIKRGPHDNRREKAPTKGLGL